MRRGCGVEVGRGATKDVQRIFEERRSEPRAGSASQAGASGRTFAARR
jgi:hypothetical protein